MLKLEFTVYSGSTVIDAPGDTSITLTESRIAGSPNVTLGFQMDPPLEDLENHPMLRSSSNGEKGEFRTSSSERIWKYVLREESGRILYRGKVEELAVTNTSTGKEFDLVSYEVSYCGPSCEERSFRMTGTEEDRARAEEAMMRFAGEDSKRRTGN